MKLRRAKPERPELNGKTPQWFQDWHEYHYIRDMTEQDRVTSRNTKLIYFVLAALLAAAFTGGNVDAVGKIIAALSGS